MLSRTHIRSATKRPGTIATLVGKINTDERYSADKAASRTLSGRLVWLSIIGVSGGVAGRHVSVRHRGEEHEYGECAHDRHHRARGIPVQEKREKRHRMACQRTIKTLTCLFATHIIDGGGEGEGR